VTVIFVTVCLALGTLAFLEHYHTFGGPLTILWALGLLGLTSFVLNRRRR
jgi:hypothetical protein